MKRKVDTEMRVDTKRLVCRSCGRSFDAGILAYCSECKSWNVRIEPLVDILDGKTPVFEESCEVCCGCYWQDFTPAGLHEPADGDCNRKLDPEQFEIDVAGKGTVYYYTCIHRRVGE